NKGGVYFEAGIARGLNRPVILTCNDEDKSEIHFDTKQINTIFWEVNTDEGKEEFAKKLKRRIRSTIDQNRNAM
ncbi:MAG: hypothetical protein IKN43_03095, partial [Selenomonadaceae bacterium]|nr:hypothetical protein [Selenomonadaceae bacterium]